MVQTLSMLAGTEAAVEDAAAGGVDDAQDGLVDEALCVGRLQLTLDSSRQQLVHRGNSDALGSCRAGLLSPMDGLVDEVSARRAEGGQ